MQIYFPSRPLLIFIKGANISGGHVCIYIYIYVYIIKLFYFNIIKIICISQSVIYTFIFFT